MHVAQPGEVGRLIGDGGVPGLVPDAAAGRAVQPVEVLGRAGVELAEKNLQVAWIAGREGDEMIVVDQDGPGLEQPVLGIGQLEEAVLHPGALGGCVEKMVLEIGSARNDERALLDETVDGCVGPVAHLGLLRNGIMRLLN